MMKSKKLLMAVIVPFQSSALVSGYEQAFAIMLQYFFVLNILSRFRFITYHMKSKGIRIFPEGPFLLHPLMNKPKIPYLFYVVAR